jgi:CRISP-associated protein Cas1
VEWVFLCAIPQPFLPTIFPNDFSLIKKSTLTIPFLTPIPMRTLYISQQGCSLSLRRESVIVQYKGNDLAIAQLPLLEQILVFGKSQLTTQLICACLQRSISIGYLSKVGHCYGRLIPIEQGYRQLVRYQQQLSLPDRLTIARQFVWAKLKNSRVLLMRHRRKQDSPAIAAAVQLLDRLADDALMAESIDRLMGLEGAGAAQYFAAFADCLQIPEFAFTVRSRRPPKDPVNAMLSFGYQLLWNHLLSLIELQGLDPYHACLHQGTERHAALASDLLEEFRAPIVDSLTLYLVNRGMMKIEEDFNYKNDGCYLNTIGRKKFLKAFLQRMEEEHQNQDGEQVPRWDSLLQQVRQFKRFVYEPSRHYQPYLIR